MATYYKNSSGKFLVYNNKLMIKLTAALPDGYDYRGESGDSIELDLGNNKKVLLTYVEDYYYPHQFSADFSLAVVTDDPSEPDYELVHWGSYYLSEYYMQKTIYLYDLGDTYDLPSNSGTSAGEYIYANYTPLARLSWNFGAGYLEVSRY